jgi:D-lactate dehydrogenase (cytochrome)
VRAPAPDIAEKLADAIGADAVSTGPSDLRLHSEDLSFHPGSEPDVVAFARSSADVAAVLRVAGELRVPVVPFGAGSSLDGHVIPVHGGVALDLTRMDRIVSVSRQELTATVEAGVTRLALERRVAQHGLFFPVDPGADATLGGMAATNAAGTMTVRYGKMRPQVLALEVALPGGALIRTGSRAAKTSAGYDLTGLMVGSEGTLGVITELTLRLQGIPDVHLLVRASFADVDAACAMATSVVAAGVAVNRLELIDEWEVRAANHYAGSGFPDGAMLFVELAGAAEAVDGELAYVRALLAETGATAVLEERDPTRQRKVWRTRHDLFFAEKSMAPGREALSTDVCVPLGELAGAIRATRAAIDSRGLLGGVSAHAGDGNIHAGVLFDPADADEAARVDDLVEELVDDALARGGTCSGEHGIGLGKVGALRREHGDQLDLMRAIKRAFDPDGIMNPSKVLPTVDNIGSVAASPLPRR